MATQQTPHWLKSIGSASDPMVEDYLTAPWGKGGRLDLLDEIRFAKNKRPSGINPGDHLVLYAAGHERIFGIATVLDGEPYEHVVEGEERWPWALRVEVPMLVGTLRIAPPLSSMKVGPLSVRQQSHISLDDEQYRLAVGALTAAIQA